MRTRSNYTSRLRSTEHRVEERRGEARVRSAPPGAHERRRRRRRATRLLRPLEREQSDSQRERARGHREAGLGCELVEVDVEVGAEAEVEVRCGALTLRWLMISRRLGVMRLDVAVLGTLGVKVELKTELNAGVDGRSKSRSRLVVFRKRVRSELKAPIVGTRIASCQKRTIA